MILGSRPSSSIRVSETAYRRSRQSLTKGGLLWRKTQNEQTIFAAQETHYYGVVAEWLNAAVLETVGNVMLSLGPNPSFAARGTAAL